MFNLLCRNALHWNIDIDQIDRILGDNNMFCRNLVNLGNRTGIFLFTFDKEFFVVLFDANQNRLFNRMSPIIHHNGFILDNGKFNGVLKCIMIRETVTIYTGVGICCDNCIIWVACVG